MLASGFALFSTPPNTCRSRSTRCIEYFFFFSHYTVVILWYIRVADETVANLGIRLGGTEIGKGNILLCDRVLPDSRQNPMCVFAGRPPTTEGLSRFGRAPRGDPFRAFPSREKRMKKKKNDFESDARSLFGFGLIGRHAF